MIVGSLFKKAGETKSYAVDWSDRLGTDPIETYDLTVPDGITVSDDANTPTVVSMFISDGTPGTVYEIGISVTTLSGLVLEQSVLVRVSAIVVGTNAYAELAEADQYFAIRETAAWLAANDGAREAALIRGTTAIDARYRGRWPGYKTSGRSQSLEWPRISAYDAEDLLIASDEIPQEVIDATCQAALRELAEPGSMMPDLERGGRIQRLKAGSVEVEYAGNAEAVTTFQIIDGILSGLLGAQQASFVGRAVRG